MHKRTSSVLARVTWLLPVTAMSLAMLGCPGQELAPLTPCTVSAVSERVDQAGVSDVDLLFMIDNSGSMATKQAKLAKQLPRLLSVLTSGDRCTDLPDGETCPYDNTTDTKRTFTAVKSLHLGVVTSNAGGLDDAPANSGEAIRSCIGEGDEGKLQSGTDIAVNGVIAKKNEFEGYAEGETVIPGAPDCADIGTVDRYQEYSVADKNLDQTKESFGCISRVGVRGCPFEQQLESPWRALAPSDGKGDEYNFINGTKGQGDDYNEGFLRDDAILAVLLVTDEDDCAITDAGKGMFAQTKEAQDMYGDLNLRCGKYYTDESLILPTSRYVTGFQSLKPDNFDRVIFAAITGVAPELIGKPYDDILADDSMIFKENPNKMGFPLPSCLNSTGSEAAYPPIRIVNVVKDFDTNGILYSICEDDYAPALNLLIEKIANKLKGNCLPRKLSPDETGKVNCDVYELLPKDNNGCDKEQGLEGEIVKRKIRENNETVERDACKMSPIAIQIGADGKKTADPAGRGWYYDDFADALVDDCPENERQRISFQFGAAGNDLPSGAGATFECFQPVARIDLDAKGFDAVNTTCPPPAEGVPGSCEDRQDPEGGYKLLCVASSATCQIECKANPDCPPGWVCSVGSTKGDPIFCQLPTCPQDNKPAATDGT